MAERPANCYAFCALARKMRRHRMIARAGRPLHIVIQLQWLQQVFGSSQLSHRDECLARNLSQAAYSATNNAASTGYAPPESDPRT